MVVACSSESRVHPGLEHKVAGPLAVQAPKSSCSSHVLSPPGTHGCTRGAGLCPRLQGEGGGAALGGRAVWLESFYAQRALHWQGSDFQVPAGSCHQKRREGASQHSGPLDGQEKAEGFPQCVMTRESKFGKRNQNVCPQECPSGAPAPS